MLKTNILMKKFRDNSYFIDLSDYIKCSVEKENLSYNNLKYLYDNLYKHQSQFIKQNIYPVCEFLKKGYSFEECEKLANLLQDAKELTIFCYDKTDKGKTYNKLFNDLIFVYNNYDKYIKIYGENKESAYNKIKHQLEITTTFQRQIESELSCNKVLWKSEIDNYENHIIEKIKEEKQKIVKFNFKGDKTNITEKYNRLVKTLKEIKEYKNSNYKLKENKGYDER